MYQPFPFFVLLKKNPIVFIVFFKKKQTAKIENPSKENHIHEKHNSSLFSSCLFKKKSMNTLGTFFSEKVSVELFDFFKQKNLKEKNPFVLCYVFLV